MKAMLIGNLTIDQNTIENNTYTMPGGTVYFMARTFENLGVDTTIVSSYGSDFPKRSLTSVSFVPEKPLFTKTLKFRNIYKNGKRKQKVEYFHDYLNFILPVLLRSNADSNIVMIAPVINNINYLLLEKIKKAFPISFCSLLPQGFFRKIDKSGKINSITYAVPDEIISFLDFICLSELDTQEVDEKAKKWSILGPIVAVTRAEMGSSLYKNGERIDTPAFRVGKITDPTGAGDAFAAGFSYLYYKSRDIYKALEFAHATAALSLRFRSYKLQYNYQDVLNLAKSQRRGINI